MMKHPFVALFFVLFAAGPGGIGTGALRADPDSTGPAASVPASAAPATAQPSAPAPSTPAAPPGPPAPAVELGIDVLAANRFSGLEGKRIGLLTNQSGVNGLGVSTIDVLRNAPNLKLVALYAPEHGLYGAEIAGDYVANTKDPHTGLPVYSLFGPNREPTPDMLKDIDVMVFDIQDIGCRSYTFISTMGLAMEACGLAGKEFYVLDRPNPLGGTRIEGPPLNPAFRSFVGQWDIPYVYGLTVGELAYMIHDEKWIKARPRLTVVPMRGWTRDMSWAQTGLIWVPPSPHIPTAESALDYVVTGLWGEFPNVNNGIGTTLPFGRIGAPDLDRFALQAAMEKRNLSGFLFVPSLYKPFYGSLRDLLVSGLEIHYSDPVHADLMQAGLILMEEIQKLYGKEIFSTLTPDGLSMMDKEAGGDAVRLHFTAMKPAQDLLDGWQPALDDFRARRAKYLLYK